MVRAFSLALAITASLFILPAAHAQDMSADYRALIADAATYDDGANFEAVITMIARNAEDGSDAVLAAVRELAAHREAEAARILGVSLQTEAAQAAAPAPAPAPSTATAEVAPAPADLSPDRGWLGGWSGRVSAGLTFVSGNSDQQSYTLGLHLDREFGDRWRLTNRINYGYAESSGVVSQDQVQIESRVEKAISERWGLFLGGQYDRDRLSSYDWTAFLSAGVTWQAIASDDIDWSLRAGPGVRYLTPMAGPNETQAVLDLGSDFEWTITDTSSFGSETTFLAAESSKLQQVFSFTTSVTEAWALELGWRYQYEFEPLPGFENSDSTVTVSVVREF
ncbi:DUF481 domain-containing protein [Hyphobacterium marinum]|uniref:DUF481 domain-containing protein n=1 Tax=Hyphobacterium marinum TaxID=3116574 RepID=A0ABU7LXW4_9PROT|nr:DUF481 domain-containing protein [Hyphobacterium sp. Y6023]MEE2566364.1 DUF481 domain-containing protein [Hyphobacterium sp. Y6023]